VLFKVHCWKCQPIVTKQKSKEVNCSLTLIYNSSLLYFAFNFRIELLQ
jgi:hypothetical protein